MALEQNKPINSDFEKLKLLYEENAAQFRYFLTWRQVLLAGYFAIIVALAIGFNWAIERPAFVLFIFPLAGAALSVLFWALDLRNRELYQLTSKVGAKLEEQLGLKGMGHFGAYSSSETKLPHSKILAIFYLGCGVLMFLFAVSILLFVNLKERLFSC